MNNKPISFKLKSRWLNRSEQDMPDIAGKSPTPVSVSVSSAPDDSASNSIQMNDISTPSMSDDQLQKIIDEVVATNEKSKMMPGFEIIQDNIYLVEKRKSKSKDSKRMICECTLPEDDDPDVICCGNGCLNRDLYIECGSKCRCKDRCSNQRFQKHQYAPVETFDAGLKGLGLRATAPIRKDTFIMEYVGEVLDEKKFHKRTKKYAKDSEHKHHYFMMLRNDEIIDATQKGSISRFINHSCEPNCETQKWTVDGRLRIGFFSIKDIDEGEELTFDYRFQRYGKEAQKCYCGAVSCRGFIGGDSPTISINQKRSSRDAERKRERAQRAAYIEDTMFDQELTDLLGIGTLKTRDQVVTFCRLMVRAEDITLKMQLLDLLANTSEQCLRLFIDHHGCRLLWLWMVNDQEYNGLNWTNFQISILNILKRLPIPHRNMVQDSRLLSTVERWINNVDLKSISRRPSQPSDDDIIKALLNDLVNQISCDETPGTSEGSVSVKEDTTDLSEQSLVSQKKEVIELAESVLAQWANLKENFRIPKKRSARSSSKSGKGHDEIYKKDDVGSTKKRRRRSSSTRRGRSNSRSRSPTPKHRRRHLHARSRSRSYTRSRSRTRSYSRSRSRSRDYRSRYPRRSRSPRRHEHHSSRWKKRSPDRAGGMSSVVVVPATEVKKTKEERRREFEAAALKQQEEVEKKRLEEAAAARLDEEQAPIGSMVASYNVIGGSAVAYWPPSVGNAMPAAPGTAPAVMALLVFDQNTRRYWWQEQLTKVLVYPAETSHIAAVQAGDYSVIPHFYSDPATGLIHEIRTQPLAAANVTGADDLAEVDMTCDEETTSKEGRITSLKQEILHLQQQLEEKKTELQWLLGSEQAAVEVKKLPPHWKATRDDEGNVYYFNTITKRVQWDPPTWEDHKLKEKSKSNSVAKKTDRHAAKYRQLSKNHHIKRKLKADETKKKKLNIQPKPEPKIAEIKTNEQQVSHEKDEIIIKSEPVEVQSIDEPANSAPVEPVICEENVKKSPSSTPPVVIAPSTPSLHSSYNTPIKDGSSVNHTPHGTTMAAADTSSEVVKKLKESFKSQVSNHVVKYLSPYRKQDCKLGKISNNEDFKHLARKLTHAVMEKELKHCQQLEDLRVTESVLHKAKDYVKKYMTKIGPEYKRTNGSP